MDLTKEQEIKVMAAVESVIESSDLEFYNDHQYDLVCDAVEAGIKTIDPVFDTSGNVTEAAKKAGLDAGLLVCDMWRIFTKSTS
jgi:hypothetical protein